MIKKRTVAVSIGLGIFLFPIVLAMALVSDARNAVYFGERINFIRHSTTDNLSQNKVLSDSDRIHNVVGEGLPVPRDFRANMPQDLDTFTVSDHKAVFVASLLPLILRANEMIMADRLRLVDLRSRLNQHEDISDIEGRWILERAERYGAGDQIISPQLIDQLLLRVDAIPPSLALAQAAIESGWGTSRFVREGNALYGQWTWNDENGIIPEGRGEGQRFAIRAFDYLIQSVISYAHNLNTHTAYSDFRQARANMRISGDGLDGHQLAETLIYYSTRREDYVIDLRRIIDVNNFIELDKLSLEPLWWAAP